MSVAGSPGRAPRHALLVGSNPALMRVFRTYLSREGVRCTMATPEGVTRALAGGGVPVIGDGSVHGGGCLREGVTVALVVASPGIDVGQVRVALASLPATAGVPVVVVESLAGKGGSSVASGGHAVPTLAWPFRLREIMEALTAAVALRDVPPVRVARASHGARGARHMAVATPAAPVAVDVARA